MAIEHAAPDVIAARRRALGLSQHRLATLAGCSRTSIALLEGGYAPQRSAVLPRVVAAINDYGTAGQPSRVTTQEGNASARHDEE